MDQTTCTESAAPEKPWRVTCPSTGVGVPRRSETFETEGEAREWTEWGHCCLSLPWHRLDRWSALVGDWVTLTHQMAPSALVQS